MPGKKYINNVSNQKSTNLKENYFVSKYEIQTDISTKSKNYCRWYLSRSPGYTSHRGLRYILNQVNITSLILTLPMPMYVKVFDLSL